MNVETKMEDRGRKLNWLEACAMLRCGRTKFYNLIEQGILPAYRYEGMARGLWVYEADVKNLIKPIQKN